MSRKNIQPTTGANSKTAQNNHRPTNNQYRRKKTIYYKLYSNTQQTKIHKTHKIKSFQPFPNYNEGIANNRVTFEAITQLERYQAIPKTTLQPMVPIHKLFTYQRINICHIMFLNIFTKGISHFENSISNINLAFNETNK